jgi:hypothetical protein
MTERGMIAWACYWAGDIWWRGTEWLCNWFEWPYVVYQRLMCWSDYWQGDGEDGPWRELTEEERLSDGEKVRETNDKS